MTSGQDVADAPERGTRDPVRALGFTFVVVRCDRRLREQRDSRGGEFVNLSEPFGRTFRIVRRSRPGHRVVRVEAQAVDRDGVGLAGGELGGEREGVVALQRLL
jgi:hypothetical protein